MGSDWEGEIYTHDLKRRRPPRFELTGGAVCLDFVNTLDDRFSAEPKELLKHYVDLARFGEDTGILGDAQVDRLMTRSVQRPEEAQRALASAVQQARDSIELKRRLIADRAFKVCQRAKNAAGQRRESSQVHAVVPKHARNTFGRSSAEEIEIVFGDTRRVDVFAP